MMDLFTGHSGVMGQNFLTLVLGLMVFFYYGRLALRTPRSDPAWLLLGGIALGGLGWAIHRGYWWIWRFELSLDNKEAASALVDNADWLTLAVAMVAASYIIHLNRWARKRLGVWSWPASILAAVCIYIIGALPGVVL